MGIGQGSVLGSGAVQAGIRTVVLASADAGLRERLRASLVGLRWQVREAGGGAAAMGAVEPAAPALIQILPVASPPPTPIDDRFTGSR